MKVLTFILPFFLILSLASGREVEGHKEIWSSFGHYPLKANELTLEIKKDSGGLIQLCVTNPAGLISQLDTRASIHHRWFVFWDEQRMSLWFYSGDIGCSVFSIDAIKGIAVEPGSFRDNTADIPEPLWMELPGSVRVALEQQRK